MNKLQGNIIATVIATILLAACGKLEDNIITPPFVFVTDRHRVEDLNSEIYFVASAGVEPVRITENTETDWMPTWSPLGSRIAFCSTREGNFDIFTMVFTGEGAVNLTNSPGVDRAPEWSPDGKKIAFFSERSNGTGLYIMDEDGSDQKILVERENVAGIQWSQDGSKIIFRDGMIDVIVVDSDGKNLENVTANYMDTEVDIGLIRYELGMDFSMSPDGSMIALSYRSSTSDIVVLLDDGKTIRHRMLDAMVDEGEPAFSPDGKNLAFTRNNQICLIDAVEWEMDNVVCHDMGLEGIGNPQWSHDSKFIAFIDFSVQEDGSQVSNLYMMRADGSELFTIIDDMDEFIYELEWAPGYPEPGLY